MILKKATVAQWLEVTVESTEAWRAMREICDYASEHDRELMDDLDSYSAAKAELRKRLIRLHGVLSS